MELKNKDIIVFAGDSTTDANKGEDGIGNGYVRLVRNALIAFRPNEEFTVINAGISGNKSADLLERWDRDVTAYDPDIVFCMIGINDVWRHFDYLDPSDRFVSAKVYEKNLEAICEKAKTTEIFFLFVYNLLYFVNSMLLIFG